MEPPLRRLLGFAAGILFLAFAAFLANRASGPSPCVRRCMSDQRCQDALAFDGIIPRGGSQGDRSLCNGICSTLRSQNRRAASDMQALGMPASPSTHPCLETDKQ